MVAQSHNPEKNKVITRAFINPRLRFLDNAHFFWSWMNAKNRKRDEDFQREKVQQCQEMQMQFGYL